MRLQFLFLLLFALNFSLVAQKNNIEIHGTLSDINEKESIKLTNIDGLSILIPLKENGTFVFHSNDLPKGFYQLDEIGSVYLDSGFKFTINPKNKDYSFDGTGAVENNAIRVAENNLHLFMPVNPEGNALMPFTQAGYYIEAPIFFAKMDSLEKLAKTEINKSNNSFFRKYATLDLHFYIKNLMYGYFAFYGTDIYKMEHLFELMSKLDKTAPDFGKKAMELSESIHTKKMSTAHRQKLDTLIYRDWDKNDEALFRNSGAYKTVLTNYFAAMAYNPKYFKLTEATLSNIKRESADIKTLTVVQGEITNTYIRDYYNYTLTTSILKTTKDTTTLRRIHDSYVASATRQDYLKNIEDLYTTALTYNDNGIAPEFKYNDINGKPVSLQSMRGKYVYIDVWATWCGPCKAEIPHLKKLEETYGAKNIHFVSISVDQPRDKNKWATYVKTNKLQGTQLMTDNAFDSPFISKMLINAIPRFILIDPNGKIVSASALRPSDNKLKDTFDLLLK